MPNRSTILLVEDDQPLRDILKLSFRAEGYRVLTAGSAERGLALLRSDAPDLIVLDVVLPGMDGLDMCRQVRQRSDIPILFLTGKRGEADKIVGLRLGGDDYVTKPFALAELLARIAALDRRRLRAARPGSESLSAGGVTLDPSRREVCVRGKPVPLDPKEFELLRLIMASGDSILSRDQIMKKVWGYARVLEIETRTVDQHVATLRRKLGPEHRLIETVPKFGYRLKMKGKAGAGRRARISRG